MLSQQTLNGVPVFQDVPDGWRVLDAPAYPKGFRWIDNTKSRFGKDRVRALVREAAAITWKKQKLH